MTAPLEGKDKTTEFHQLDLPDVEPNGYTKGKSIFQNNDEASDMSNSPLQKRQRVARACDECRRRKIKCNGKQPCIHCQVYTYDCAYGKPPNRYRDSAPQYVETLERRLQRAEALLKKSMPDVNIADLKLDRAIKQELRLQVQVREKGLKKEDNSSLSPVEPDEHFESTISGVGQLEFDSSGEYYFQGPSSSEVFFKMIKNHLKGWLGHDYHVPVISSLTKYSNIVGLEPPRLSAIGSRSRSNSKRFKADICDLPPEATAYQLCSHSLEYATGLLQIVHVPSQLWYRQHSARVSSKALEAAIDLGQLKGSPPVTARQLFTVIVASIVDYASTVWRYAYVLQGGGAVDNIRHNWEL